MHIDPHDSALCVLTLQNASCNPHAIPSAIRATRLQLSLQSKLTLTSPFCTQCYKKLFTLKTNSKIADNMEAEPGKWPVQVPHGVHQRHWLWGWRLNADLIMNTGVPMLIKSSYRHRNILLLSQVTLEKEGPLPDWVLHTTVGSNLSDIRNSSKPISCFFLFYTEVHFILFPNKYAN